MTTTTNLAEFGYREKKLAAELLTSMCENNLPDDFYEEEVTVMFNKYSGCVFLTNQEYQVCMLNNNKLESFYTTPYEGKEGFYDELVEMYKSGELNHAEDIDYLKDLAKNRGKRLPKRKLNETH